MREREKKQPAQWIIGWKHIPSATGIEKQVSGGANTKATSLPLWWQRRSYPEHTAPSCVITGCLSSSFPLFFPSSTQGADSKRVKYTETKDFQCVDENRRCLQRRGAQEDGFALKSVSPNSLQGANSQHDASTHTKKKLRRCSCFVKHNFKMSNLSCFFVFFNCTIRE